MELDEKQLEMDEMAVKLGEFLVRLENPREEEFAQLVAAGTPISAACSQAQVHHQAGKRTHVAARINYLRHSAARKVNITVDGVLAELLVLKELAFEKGQFARVQSLLSDIARIGGLDQSSTAIPAMSWKEVAEAVAENRGLTLDQMRMIAKDNTLVERPALPDPHKVH